MIVAIGSDHRGFRLKKTLVKYLEQKEHKVIDFGTFALESCDYPVYCQKVGLQVARRRAQRGIFICKTGIGSSIALNKIKGIRASLVHNVKAARFARLHNDSNVLVLGSDFVKADYAKRIVRTWLTTGFEGTRHLRRIAQISRIEEGHEL